LYYTNFKKFYYNIFTFFTVVNCLSQYVLTRYKVLCIIDKRCRVRNYVREVRWYIYTSLRGQVCAHVIVTPSHNNAQVSAVTLSWLYYISSRFIARLIHIILNSSSYIYIYRAGSFSSNSFSNKLYRTLIFP
jgi:hypothetical protein